MKRLRNVRCEEVRVELPSKVTAARFRLRAYRDRADYRTIYRRVLRHVTEAAHRGAGFNLAIYGSCSDRVKKDFCDVKGDEGRARRAVLTDRRRIGRVVLSF